jgi:Na+/melibiose symporter-like transporter
VNNTFVFAVHEQPENNCKNSQEMNLETVCTSNRSSALHTYFIKSILPKPDLNYVMVILIKIVMLLYLLVESDRAE